MNFKNIVFVFPLIISFATALSVDEVSGKYTIHGTAFNTHNDTVTDQLSTLKVSKIQGSASNVVVNMDWSGGSRGACSIENATATVLGHTLVLKQNDCTLNINYDVTNSLIAFADANGGGACRAEFCGSGVDFSDVGFPWNSQERNGKVETTLKPIKGQSLCFKRSYTTEHLNASPKQLPSFMTLKVTGKQDGTFSNELFVFTRDDSGTNYQGTGSCSNDPAVPLSDDKGSCGNSNDGGQFLIENNKDGSIFVKPFNWVVLRSPDSDTATIRLDKDDAANSVFKLYPVGCGF